MILGNLVTPEVRARCSTNSSLSAPAYLHSCQPTEKHDGSHQCAEGCQLGRLRTHAASAKDSVRFRLEVPGDFTLCQD